MAYLFAYCAAALKIKFFDNLENNHLLGAKLLTISRTCVKKIAILVSRLTVKVPKCCYFLVRTNRHVCIISIGK